MASADLRDDLNCPICTDIYTDPVTLPCGHNYCQGCIEKTWDWQEMIDEEPACPECRRRYRRRPELKRNHSLRNIAERFCSNTDKEHHGTGISKSSECSTHHKILEYYCCEDGACVCVSCCLAGDHRGHKVELLDEASEKKKEKLRNVLDKLTPQREATERKVQRLQENWGEVKRKAASEMERVTVLFRDIREQLKSLEKRVLSEISRQEKHLSLTLTNLIQQLEIRKDELSSNISHIEKLCSMADPITVLQEQAIDEAQGRDDILLTKFKGILNWFKESIHGIGGDEITVPAVGDLDPDGISEQLLTGIAGIMAALKGRIYRPLVTCSNPSACGQEATDIILDRNTAGRCIFVSKDGRTASYTSKTQKLYQQPPLKVQSAYLVLSTKNFAFGRHCWDVEGSESTEWWVGVSYPSMAREGRESWIGNNKSWGFCRWNNNTYSVRHGGKEIQLPYRPSCTKIRISMD